MEISKSRGRDPCGKRGRIEFVLRIEDERCVQRADSQVICGLAQQQVQKMRRHIRIVRLCLDSFSSAMELMPIKEHRRECGQQTICDLMLIAPVALRLDAAQCGTTCPQ